MRRICAPRARARACGGTSSWRRRTISLPSSWVGELFR